ncbi:MAG: hypothetical protein OXT03_04890 [Alphaproteobacteria bacterium]|nr:hypothetical protein [Alphaproteobacteria bacterium]
MPARLIFRYRKTFLLEQTYEPLWLFFPLSFVLHSSVPAYAPIGALQGILGGRCLP